MLPLAVAASPWSAGGRASSGERLGSKGSRLKPWEVRRTGGRIVCAAR